MSTLAEIITLLERRYPPELASDWDAIGLIAGDPAASVGTVLFAVDPVPDVVDQALLEQVDLIVTHHPLFLQPVHGVPASTAKGRMIHDCISHGIALYCAHTNADHADPGVSDALADALGVTDTIPIDPAPSDPSTGTGRIGSLPTAMSLADFTAHLQAALPPTRIRVAGDPTQRISRVAVCGGAGDSLLPLVGDADVFVTADLRHHRAQDHLVGGGCALIDISHWASEWPWLGVAAAALESDVRASGGTVRTIVSSISTDPWNGRES
jgi:dinuclear metal center YbgI/SA1388 family protein